MGRIIQQNNGKTTVYVTGENLSALTPTNNTYYLGVDLTSGVFEKKNPNGVTVNLETFTGGTVDGVTTFTNGLNADVVSATTYLNLPGDIYLTGGTYSAGTLTLTSSGFGNIVVTGFTSGSGGGVIETTYVDLVSDILSSGLTVGTFYLITDYQTCYDQPDFDYDNNPITTGNYKQGPVEPLMVLATSVNTISTDAYQPAYPNDKIKYDWSFSATEVTNNVAFGRITERVDEFNNRTDYDHRNILFKRYKLYTIRQEQPLNGFVELQNDGTVLGTNTSFSSLTVGDVVYMAGLFYEITAISGDTTMLVSGDTISPFGCCSTFYKAIEETNDTNGYFSIKRTNVKTSDFVEYTTFGDAISNDYAKNNYVGNYTNNYQNIGSGIFLLPNNVFLEGAYESNKFGDYCYNNTFGTDNQNNIWGDYCYENVSTNDIDNNIIGHNFNRNLINTNLTDNHIGNDFNNNQLLAGNSDDFEDNIIGNGFSYNLIYSRFYKNEILDNFNDNNIGDLGNLNNFEFYRNYIRNGFNNNTIRQNFQNNQIGTNYQSNEINGDFINNTILNGFNNNTIGYWFWGNTIDNGFNNNRINDDFYANTIGFNFRNNLISNQFGYNHIGNEFGSNTPSNNDLFGWGDLNNISTRTYDTFNNIVGGGQLGNKILGKELVMRVISTSQYFRIKFTQWTQNNNGGGFQYERQELDSGGGSIGSFVTFTKTNYGSEVDIIIPGVLEITRGDNSGIYNIVTESSWNGSVSPDDTEWNSIYTQPNNGERFAYNKINNNFYNNTIGSDFGYGGGDPYGNVIFDDFANNIIGQFAYNNAIGNRFQNNTVGDNFENNTIKNYFELNNIGEVFESNLIGDYFNNNSIGDNFTKNTIKNYFVGNTILDGFESNEIGDYFGNNGSGPGSPVQNTIFNDFKYNKIGNFFGNDTNFIGGGTNGDGGNIINDFFQFNTIGDNFIFNALDLNFVSNKIGNDFWFNNFGINATDNSIGNLFVGNIISSNFISNKFGNYSPFNEIYGDFQYNNIGDFFGNAGLNTQNQIFGSFTNNSIGNYFGDDGTQLDGGNIINVDFYDNSIGNRYYNNLIDGEFFSNIIASDFSNNSISGGTGSFFNNYIGDAFSNNSTNGIFSFNHIGSVFSRNNIGSGFNYNLLKPGNFRVCTIGDNFVNNIISANLSSIDFTSGPATHVYANYNCTIFSRQDGTPRLSYYDNSDILNVVNIDA